MKKKNKKTKKKTAVKKSKLKVKTAKKKSLKKQKPKALKSKKRIKKVKKGSKPVRAAKTAPQPLPTGYRPAANEIKLGEVEDYFSHIGVVALILEAALVVGDTIHIHGHTTDLTQKVESMQINHVPQESAKRGDSVGIKVNDKCRKGDKVYGVR